MVVNEKFVIYPIHYYEIVKEDKYRKWKSNIENWYSMFRIDTDKVFIDGTDYFLPKIKNIEILLKIIAVFKSSAKINRILLIHIIPNAVNCTY